MKAKTKKKLERIIILALVAVFVLGTFLLYLPISTQTKVQSTAPPLDNSANQGMPPTVVITGQPVP